MQTLRKKTSPLKYKNETSRFLGEGVSFKAKLIGILEVSEARGDRMCQEALSDLKMAIRAAGEHKQRITINIAIDGLRLRDEKTGDSLYHHPVHKISFIAQDMSDSRAFGYIFGSPDTGHRFFGIKTDKAASQVVIAMRDLFQVVFALKKKEIELAKQHLDKSRYGSSPLFSERSLLNSKQSSSQDASKTTSSDSKGVSSSENRTTPAVADLVDLELELNSLQQGLTQMERITPSDPFGSKDDPFGDSFTSFPKPILPPPPSGRERANRTSESSSLFSPKTPHTAASVDSSSTTDIFNTSHDLNTPKDFTFNEFNSSHDEPSSGDWFTPPAGNSLFEEPSQVLEPTKDQQHEIAKQEILSQFDVFTELDPLGTKTLNTPIGTGKIKPYVDKKDFFQELKNPPKKVLNDLVSKPQTTESSIFPATFDQKNSAVNKSSNSIYNNDPFGEDPFDQTDPFADSDFAKQDVFDTEFNVFDSQNKLNDLSLDNKVNNNADLSQLFSLSKSPKNSLLEKQMTLSGTSPRSSQFHKQNTFDSQFEFKKSLTKLYENPSLDMSSESECAPDPPPRPTNTLTQIKPPPLPPKKQAGDLAIKPPPRPPHIEESHYDYMEKYETGSISFHSNTEKSPPLPVPARKSKFESDFMPEEEDYLTPISFPTVKKDTRPIARNAGPILLPPPQKVNKKNKPVIEPPTAVTISSILESKSNVITTTPSSLPNLTMEGLDITLSQLTLSGLNELANKLNIPANQLSNMTLVQLTNYLSNFIKNASNESVKEVPDESGSENFPTFKADFADFNQFNNSATSTSETSYDRYAVFRELLEEEIKQTKIDTEPEELEELEEDNEVVEETKSVENVNIPIMESVVDKYAASVVDKYAALREIAESDINIITNKNIQDDEIEEEDEDEDEGNESPEHLETIDESIVEQNNINEDRNNGDHELKPVDMNITDDVKNDNDKLTTSKENIIEYSIPLDNIVEVEKATTPIKSPILKVTKSPVPVAVTEIVQGNNRLNSGSLSDVVSGSSPEVDLTGSASENAAKKNSDTTGESWAIFDQPNLLQESTKDTKAAQSEEGVSPWSSDSKEFGNGSPPEWRQRMDSGSGGEHWSGGVRSGARREQDGWWDTSAEPEVQYYPANRRSTDSYEDECYDCYDRPRRRRQTTWSGQTAGGHSSSSRDVSPWEEEPRRRDGRQSWSSRHARQHSFERHNRERRHTDSWDEEDDYDYEDEHVGRHWSDRHSRDSERHNVPPPREVERDRHLDDWDERRHRRRREVDRERWCCPDYDVADQVVEKPPSRYSSGRWSNTERRKHDERYYGRESQESPWEDEYGNEPEDPQPHYLTARRTRIRPSSASEMDRKTGEIKARPGQFYYGGSDGERDRRYKSGRRSKSRDSQYSETMHNRHKIDPGLTMRPPHRVKQYPHQKSQFENDFNQEIPPKKLENPKEVNAKKPASVLGRKKSKESPKTEEINTFPRKGTSRAQSLFENDFVPSESESPVSARVSQRFTFENDFETSEAESPTVSKPVKATRPKYEKKITSSWFETDVRRPKSNSKPMRYKQKSLFEDDFSPTDKVEVEDNIPSIKEEHGGEGDEVSSGNMDNVNSRKRLFRIANRDGNIKKSESVNIFARESDPFDDDFFSTNSNTNGTSDVSNVTNSRGELKWTEQFSEFDLQRSK